MAKLADLNKKQLRDMVEAFDKLYFSSVLQYRVNAYIVRAHVRRRRRKLKLIRRAS